MLFSGARQFAKMSNEHFAERGRRNKSLKTGVQTPETCGNICVRAGTAVWMIIVETEHGSEITTDAKIISCPADSKEHSLKWLD